MKRRILPLLLCLSLLLTVSGCFRIVPKAPAPAESAKQEASMRTVRISERSLLIFVPFGPVRQGAGLSFYLTLF